MRLDHWMAKALGSSERTARSTIAAGEVRVDGETVRDHHREISKFSSVEHRSSPLQEPEIRRYLMVNKPVGVLSATIDRHHETVLDLIDLPDKDTLHLAGRLDRSSSGLILLTNDGKWSESLTDPEKKVPKVYLVGTDQAIPVEAVNLFAEGFHFPTEGITTRPAKLEILGERIARVTLHEGRYHQIKRMFHRIESTRLVSLHRESIGNLRLPANLGPGEWRSIEPKEVSDQL